jgi:hypothetical protein
MGELKEQVTQKNEAILPYLKHINALLQQAVTTCKAALSTELPSHTQTLPVKESIVPGKNCEHQWRFKQTSKTPGRKKSGLVLRFALPGTLSIELAIALHLMISGMLIQMKRKESYQNWITER